MYIIQKCFVVTILLVTHLMINIYRFGIDNDTTKDKSNLRIKSQKEAHKLFKAVYQNYSIRLDGTYRVVVVSKEQS